MKTYDTRLILVCAHKAGMFIMASCVVSGSDGREHALALPLVAGEDIPLKYVHLTQHIAIRSHSDID